MKFLRITWNWFQKRWLIWNFFTVLFHCRPCIPWSLTRGHPFRSAPRRPELWEYSINLSGTDHSRFFVCPAFPVTQLWPGWEGGITHHVPEWSTYPLGWWSHHQMSRFLPIPLVCGKDWTGFCQFVQDSYCTAWIQTAVTAYFSSKQLLLFVFIRRSKRW